MLGAWEQKLHGHPKERTMSRLPLLLSLSILLVGGSILPDMIQAAEATTTGTTLAKDDAEFITSALQGGMADIKTSEIALKRTVSAAEREFAQKMIDGHGKVIAELKTLAEAKGIAIPALLDEKSQKQVDELGKQSDKVFAEVYLENQIDAHKKAVSAYKEASKDAKDPEVKAFAAKNLPHLEEHLAQAKTLEKNH